VKHEHEIQFGESLIKELQQMANTEQKIVTLAQAVQAGNKLANSDSWQSKAAVVNGIGGLVGAGLAVAAAFGAHLPIAASAFGPIGTAVGVLCWGLYNIYVNVATNETLGIKTKTTGQSGVPRKATPLDKGEVKKPGAFDELL
jgi:hypothetical protein